MEVCRYFHFYLTYIEKCTFDELLDLSNKNDFTDDSFLNMENQAGGLLLNKQRNTSFVVRHHRNLKDYFDVVKALEQICPKAIPDYIRMIFMDTICANPDRHTNNFGLLRDIKTGELIGFAPNYDNNMALISRGYPNPPTKNDILINLFNDFISDHPEYMQFIPTVTEEIIIDILEELNMKVRRKEIISIIMKRYTLIKK